MSHWSQPLRVETPQHSVLITVRTINSRLWFINNKALEHYILGYLAKYQQKYNVIVYALSIQGNHIHIIARFPKANMASFMRDLNARIAAGVAFHVREFLGGPLFERRYSSQILPLDQDTENYFFYSALQAVNDGISERISDYPGYNSIYDAARNRVRTYKVIRYGEYHTRRRNDPTLSPEDFTDKYLLRFSRLPGFEDMTQGVYEKEILKRLESRRLEKVSEWRKKGHRFLSKQELRKVISGSFPKKTKKGNIRPIVLSSCRETKKKILDWYFGIVRSYREASKRFREGAMLVKFPPMTYLPQPGICPIL